ncbi:four helix bundle protein [Crocinitomicaceae bacterium]|nr:four helix bundle protein [Crocinitomicaceae bacterium]
MKKANETEYYLELLYETSYLNEFDFYRLQVRLKEILRILISIIRSSKSNLLSNGKIVNCQLSIIKKQYPPHPLP